MYHSIWRNHGHACCHSWYSVVERVSAAVPAGRARCLRRPLTGSCSRPDPAALGDRDARFPGRRLDGRARWRVLPWPGPVGVPAKIRVLGDACRACQPGRLARRWSALTAAAERAGGRAVMPGWFRAQRRGNMLNRIVAGAGEAGVAAVLVPTGLPAWAS